MKTMKTLLATGIAAATFAAPAMAELSASAAVSSQYLFRGVDQGGGGAVSGDITYSVAGFYGSVWASSLEGGSEIDLIAGWNGEFGGLGVDVGAVNYYYPADGANDTLGTYTEAYLGLSFAGVELYYYDQVAGAPADIDPVDAPNGALNDNTYVSLGYSYGPFSILAGMADLEEDDVQTYDNDYTHIDLSYAFNDNLSFTVSKITDVDDEAGMEDDTQFVVSYSLPIK